MAHSSMVSRRRPVPRNRASEARLTRRSLPPTMTVWPLISQVSTVGAGRSKMPTEMMALPLVPMVGAGSSLPRTRSCLGFCGVFLIPSMTKGMPEPMPMRAPMVRLGLSVRSTSRLSDMGTPEE